jgi:cytochrome d ubiquinol oxidase subunit II
MCAMHGAIYLLVKTEGELQDRIRRAVPRLLVVFFLLNTAVVICTLALNLHITKAYLHDIWPAIFPGLALAALIAVWRLLRAGRDLAAFTASAVMIALLLISVGIGQYPDLLISTTNASYNLTVTNAASQSNTLAVMLVIALIGMPFVILYSSGVYYIFRGKVRIERESY